MTFDYLRQSLFFFRNHIGPLALIQMPFITFLAFVQFQLLQELPELPNLPEQLDEQWIAQLERILIINWGLDLALVPIYWGATLLYLQSVLKGQQLRIAQALVLSLTCWWRLMLTYLLFMLTTLFGLVLLVIPGIYIGIRLAFAGFYCVMEGMGPVDSLKTSWLNTKDFFWPMLQGLALIIGALLLAKTLIGQMLQGQEGSVILVTLVIQFFFVLPVIYVFRIYCVMKTDDKPL